jgi:hypothetical protein
MLSVVIQCTNMLIVIMFVVMVSVVMLRVIMLRVVMLSVIMLIAIMLSVITLHRYVVCCSAKWPYAAGYSKRYHVTLLCCVTVLLS